MRNKLILFCLFSLLMTSCANTLEKDAEEAAQLQKKALLYSLENDTVTAQRSFLKVQKIMNKYRQTPKFLEFEILYNQYLSEAIDMETGL